MKIATKWILVVFGTLLALWGTTARAESTYGYSAAGAAGPTANARLNITVEVPMLILLRVGSGTPSVVDTATLTATVTGIPGGVAVPVDGSNQATDWDGTAPIWNSATAAAVRAYAWTNSNGGGTLSRAITTPFTGASGLTAGNISVASAAVSGGGLAHPGTDTGTNVPTLFAKNTLVSSDWTYSISAAALAGASAGSHTQLVTYTATSL